MSYSDSNLDKGLVNAEADRILKNVNFPLPSEIKNKKYEVIERNLGESEQMLNFYKRQLVNKANFRTKDGLINIASPKNENPRAETKTYIREHNVVSIYVHIMSKLKDYAKK